MATLIRSAKVSAAIITALGIASAALFSASMPASAQAALLTQTLDLGDSGSNVTSLQTFLSTNGDVYPSKLITGYFGQLTKAGVERFQTQNNIVSSGTPVTTGYGRVGPTTLATINAQMGGGVSTSWDTVPTISGVTVSPAANSAVISWGTNEPTKGIVYYSTNYLSEYEGATVLIGGTPVQTDSVLRTSNSVTLSNLQRGTLYYYDVYVTDSAGGDAMTMQATFRTTN